MIKKSLSIKIIVITALAFFIILISIGVFQDNLEKQITGDIYERLAELSENNASSIELKIADQFAMMETLSDYIADYDLRGDAVLSMMNKTVHSYGFLRCAITFSDGSFITHDSKNEGNALNDEYLEKGFQGIATITGPRLAVVDPTKTVILLTVPIQKNDEILAVLTCTYETQYLNKVFKMTSFQGKGYSYITDIKGNIISKPGINKMIYDGSNILEFFEKQNGYSNSEEDYKNMLDHIRSLETGSGVLKIEGEEKYISYQPLNINDWYIFSVTSGDVLAERLKNTLDGAYSFTGIVVIVFLLLTAFIVFYINRIQYKVKQDLQELAYYDDMTGIANRNLFEIRTRKALDNLSCSCAYVILNVNKFKMINDIFGFAQGDLLLRHIANTISIETKEDEVCARYEADNFHMLYMYDKYLDLEQRLTQLMNQIGVYHFDNQTPHSISLACGVYPIEDKGREVSQLGDKARMALSKAKGSHDSAVGFYDDTMIRKLKEEQEIENSMKYALENGEMKLYLQPQYSVEDCSVIGGEALVRWESPKKGMIMPDEFIPLFEKNGFIVNLDMFMLETACCLLREWMDEGTKVLPISVNQSRRCLYQSDYMEKLTKTIEKYQILPSLIELEITERAFYEDEVRLSGIIHQLHNMGFSIAMDDFGTGYSSLSMLQDIDIDILKIDKNFFKESINSKRGKKIVSNIVRMANDLNMEVVAEGIETKAQYEFLGEIHCSHVQGYYFSKPVDVIKYKKILETRCGI